MSTTAPSARAAVPDNLTIDEKRQALYASLLRYAPEAGGLRERILDRLVLGALIGSDETNPYRSSIVQQNIRFGSVSPNIRIAHIVETLQRLAAEQVIGRIDIRQKAHYFLFPSTAATLNVGISATEMLIRAAISRILADTSHLISPDVGAQVCRRFFSECCATVGQRLARTFTGHADPQEVAEAPEARAAFAAAVSGLDLPLEASESLEQRCLSFLKSRNPDDQQLKFSLTQAVYVAQLLEFDGQQFNPLSTNAFAGAVFYLDANIIIPRMLGEPDADVLDEVLRVSKTLGIELRVTRATINEIRRVAADRLREFEEIVDRLPKELTKETGDGFLNAYLRARERNPELVPAEFLRPFDDVSEFCCAKLGAVLADIVEEEAIAGRDFSATVSVIQEESIAARGCTKSNEILLHDVAHAALVEDARRTNPKTWFLTRDKAMLRAGVRIGTAQATLPFSISLAGFLQSVAPFLTSPEQQTSMAELFSGILAEHVLHTRPLFELEELRVIAELHEDVLTTPPDRLVKAFDHVKRNVLHGKTYTPSENPKVSLALRSYLSSSATEKELHLQSEVERARREVSETQRALEIAKAAREASSRAATANEEEVAILRGEVEHLRTEQSERNTLFANTARRERAVTLALSSVIGIPLLLLAAAIYRWLDSKLLYIGAYPVGTVLLIQLVAFAVIVVPLIRYLESTKLSPDWRAVVTAIVAATLLMAGKIGSDVAWARASSIVTVLLPIALGVLVFRRRNSP